MIRHALARLKIDAVGAARRLSTRASPVISLEVRASYHSVPEVLYNPRDVNQGWPVLVQLSDPGLW